MHTCESSGCERPERPGWDIWKGWLMESGPWVRGPWEKGWDTSWLAWLPDISDPWLASWLFWL